LSCRISEKSPGGITLLKTASGAAEEIALTALAKSVASRAK